MALLVRVTDNMLDVIIPFGDLQNAFNVLSCDQCIVVLVPAVVQLLSKTPYFYVNVTLFLS